MKSWIYCVLFLRYHRSLKDKDAEDEECPTCHGTGDRKDAVNFGPPVVTDPGEGFGPPGTGPPKETLKTN